MPSPEAGKRYLLVFCKRCDKGFRVMDESIGQDKLLKVNGPRRLECRSCGHVATYAVQDMRMGRIAGKPA